MARKFLYVVALLITLAVIIMISFSFFGTRIMQSVLVPRVSFAAPQPLAAGFYDRAEGWFARPDGRASDPTRWQPAGVPAPPPADSHDGAAIFFIHPTSAFDTMRWNASANDPVAAAQATRFLRLQATALAAAGLVWAPRYRQAVFGAFLTDKAEAQKAIDLAYGDVRAAFETFLRANPQGPIILAGHSQGTVHLLRLLAERVGGVDWRPRVVAVYAPGWPISVAHDLPALGFAACTAPRQTGCILSWQSFAPPAETATLEGAFDAGTGFDGKPRKGSAILCTNPLTRGAGPNGAPDDNLGLLVGDGEPRSTQLMRPANVGAKCSGRGILLLDSAPKLGPAVMPGNNYHAYDYSLFWANIRADAQERLASWHMTH
ncbi:MAG: DUF3089 domain-containing protein [Sphingobium sp.]|nr:DUF3089 domain-containing protein [Sphingobium sp.]